MVELDYAYKLLEQTQYIIAQVCSIYGVSKWRGNDYIDPSLYTLKYVYLTFNIIL